MAAFLTLKEEEVTAKTTVNHFDFQTIFNHIIFWILPLLHWKYIMNFIM